jgi:hypothetical protein
MSVGSSIRNYTSCSPFAINPSLPAGQTLPKHITQLYGVAAHAAVQERHAISNAEAAHEKAFLAESQWATSNYSCPKGYALVARTPQWGGNGPPQWGGNGSSLILCYRQVSDDNCDTANNHLVGNKYACASHTVGGKQTGVTIDTCGNNPGACCPKPHSGGPDFNYRLLAAAK